MKLKDLDNYLKNSFFIDPINTRNAYNVNANNNNNISLEETEDITIWYIKESIDGVLCGYAFTFLQGSTVPSKNYLFGSINISSDFVSLMFKDNSGSNIETGTGKIQITKNNKIIFIMQTTNSIDNAGDKIGFVHSSYMIKYNNYTKVDNKIKELISICENNI